MPNWSGSPYPNAYALGPEGAYEDNDNIDWDATYPPTMNVTLEAIGIEEDKVHNVILDIIINPCTTAGYEGWNVVADGNPLFKVVLTRKIDTGDELRVMTFEAEQLAKTDTLTFTDKNVHGAIGKTVYYYAYAVDYYGHSGMTNRVEGSEAIGSIPAPAVPTGLSFTANEAVNIGVKGIKTFLGYASWNANTEKDFDHYEVRLREGTNYQYFSTQEIYHYFKQLKEYTAYSVAVKAVNSAKKASAYCTEVSATTSTQDKIAPDAPTLSATAKAKRIDVEVTSANASDLDYYKFYVGTVSTFTPDDATNRFWWGPGKRAFLSELPDGGNPVNNTPYYFKAIAVDLVGNASASTATAASATFRGTNQDDADDGIEIVTVDKVSKIKSDGDFKGNWWDNVGTTELINATDKKVRNALLSEDGIVINAGVKKSDDNLGADGLKDGRKIGTKYKIDPTTGELYTTEATPTKILDTLGKCKMRNYQPMFLRRM